VVSFNSFIKSARLMPSMRASLNRRRGLHERACVFALLAFE